MGHTGTWCKLKFFELHGGMYTWRRPLSHESHHEWHSENPQYVVCVWTLLYNTSLCVVQLRVPTAAILPAHVTDMSTVEHSCDPTPQEIFLV